MTSGHPTHKPAELFRSDLISAMKLPDSTPMEPGSFLTIREQWRTEWEFGVQVCVSPGQIPDPKARCIDDPSGNSEDFEMPSSKFAEEIDEAEYPMYDLDELDLNWLDAVNQKRKFRALAGPSGLVEETLREALITLETKCQQNMARAIATEESLGIEYDEQTVCDVCQDRESEETNDMLFCDACNVCVHQACYGISSIPKGNWLCKVCAAGGDKPQCLLCSNRGGALKRVRPGNTNWAHLSCALWIPEIRLGNADKMEPITNVDAVPLSRWNLTCCLCRKKQGACIQCSHPSCVIAYHVTCGFQQGLNMKSRIDMVKNAVVHESYCPKHTAMRRSPSHSQSNRHPTSSPHKNHMIPHRPTQLIQLQETFYKYTSPDDLVSELKMSPKLATLLYNYWKLKRRSQHNRTLLSHLPIETSLESVKAELAAGETRYAFHQDEDFMKIVHIRQNLEKARNLIYMVQRRERLKKQILYNQANSWDMEAELLKTEPIEIYPSLTVSLEDTGNAELKDDVFVEEASDVPVRQTRSMAMKVSDSMSPPRQTDSKHIQCAEDGASYHRGPSTQSLSSQNVPTALQNHTGGCDHSDSKDTSKSGDINNATGLVVTHEDRGDKEPRTHSVRCLQSPEEQLQGYSFHRPVSPTFNSGKLSAPKYTMNSFSKSNSGEPGTIVSNKSKINFEVCPVNGSNTHTTRTSSIKEPQPTLAVTGKTQVESLVLRSGQGPNLRHRPYTVNHKTASEFT